MIKNIIYLLGKQITRHIILRKVKLKVIGNLPKKQAIIVANHDHPYDPALIMLFSKTLIHFFTANQLFKQPLVGLFLRLIQQIPVQPGMRDVNEIAFSKASFYLSRNEIVGIFPYPEDIIKKKKVLYTGLIKLIVENNVPIIPVKIELNQKGRVKSYYEVNFDKATIKVGRQIEGIRKRAILSNSQKSRLKLTKEILERIDEL